MGNSRKIEKKKKKPNIKNESDFIIINASSSDSQSEPNTNDDITIQTSYNVAADEEEVEREKHGKKMKKRKKKKTDGDESSLCKFPMNRINRIVRSEGDFRLTQEAVFLINKASEKLLDLFAEEAYESSVNKRKSYVAYQDLSSIVCKERRFEFVSDFIPVKLKAEDALEERKAAGA